MNFTKMLLSVNIFHRKISQLMVIFTVMSAVFIQASNSDTVQLVSSNIDDVLRSHELVLVNFYADWCRFSQMLSPVFADAATKIKQEFPQEGMVAFGKVDCDRETSIAAQYHVNKYPTLKIFRNGNLVKREYRGQRSTEAIGNFIRDQLKSPIEYLENIEDIDNLDPKKRHLILYVDSEDSHDFNVFRRISTTLRDDCKFHAAVGPVSQSVRVSGNKMTFKGLGEESTEMVYAGLLGNFELALQWVTDKCVPLVREITFENAEELTEEGLPFLILFHDPSDEETPEAFRNIVAKELVADKTSVNFLTADGLKFSHPLYHLGKTSKDLPVLAIDSFRHMYLWKHNPKEDLGTPGLLKQFVADLHSGKLHREFHHGPDPTPVPPAENKEEEKKNGDEDPGVIAKAEDPDNGAHIDVQQQFIMHNDGTRVQVIRVIKIGPHAGPHHKGTGGHISQQLAQIENKLTEEELMKDDNEKTEDGDAKEEEVEIPKVEEEKIDLGVVADTKGTEVVEEEKEKSVEVTTTVSKITTKQPELPPRLKKILANSHKDSSHETYHRKSESPEGKAFDASTKVLQFNKRIKVDKASTSSPAQTSKSPPESMFAKLAPSKHRYTILRDEL